MIGNFSFNVHNMSNKNTTDMHSLSYIQKQLVISYTTTSHFHCLHLRENLLYSDKFHMHVSATGLFKKSHVEIRP